jgi:hypothetical protein
MMRLAYTAGSPCIVRVHVSVRTPPTLLDAVPPHLGPEGPRGHQRAEGVCRHVAGTVPRVE